MKAAVILRKLAASLLLLAVAAAQAGVMTRSEMARRFPAPLMVGELDRELPVWPLFRQNGTATELAAYVFESVDLAPIPGFAGVPLNLLVAIDPHGGFVGVEVLSHHEPVFLDGLGQAPLSQFVKQYKNLSLKQNIRIGTGARSPDLAHAYIDGVSKATASVRIINQSILAAALKVARKKLGFAQGRDPDAIARVKPDLLEALTVREMLDLGLIQHLRISNRELELRFAGSAGAGLDPIAREQPEAAFVDLYLACVSVPSVGRSLLDERSWNKLKSRLEEGDHAFLVLSAGRYGITGDDFVRGSISDRILLQQDGLPLDLRDLDLEPVLASGAEPLFSASMTVLRVIGQAGLDPSAPLKFLLPVTRSKGIVYPERITRTFEFSYQLPARYLIPAEGAAKSWPGIWQERRNELLLLAAGLLVLGAALIMQRRLTRDGRRFAWFRRAYLAYTVVFIGYCAQGQLSIVNLTGVIQALMARRSLEFLLFDPMTVALWGCVLVSLLAWGRGTFCGWLCPFGALQELAAGLARLLHLPQPKLSGKLDARLKWVKYALLLAIIGSAFFSSEITDKLVELEPFKTAITLNFVRSWPYVAYAVGLLLGSGIVYKFYCRYLCPLGAALALLGRFRLLDWIPRRSACGTPCQTCRHRCDYQAIRPNGHIVYDECFQCMDCVVIYASDQKCAPLMLDRKRARTIPIFAIREKAS